MNTAQSDIGAATASIAAAVGLDVSASMEAIATARDSGAPAFAASSERANLGKGAAAWIGNGGSALALRASEFNRYPLRYAHASWIPKGWDGPWLARMRDGDGGKAELSLGRELMGHWKLDARPSFAFAAPSARLALIESHALRRTVLLAGLACHADAISRMLERSRVMDFRSQVGEEDYRFARFRAPLLAGALASGADGVADPVPDSGPIDWLARASASGLRMLRKCLAGAGLASRAGLKFPRAQAVGLIGSGESGKEEVGREEESVGHNSAGSVEAYVRLFRKILLQEVDPAWANLLS